MTEANEPIICCTRTRFYVLRTGQIVFVANDRLSRLYCVVPLPQGKTLSISRKKVIGWARLLTTWAHWTRFYDRNPYPNMVQPFSLRDDWLLKWDGVLILINLVQLSFSNKNMIHHGIQGTAVNTWNSGISNVQSLVSVLQHPNSPVPSKVTLLCVIWHKLVIGTTSKLSCYFQRKLHHLLHAQGFTTKITRKYIPVYMISLTRWKKC
jgi:hypothetical protein